MHDSPESIEETSKTAETSGYLDRMQSREHIVLSRKRAACTQSRTAVGPDAIVSN
jgi:Zn-finger domain-containing protein